MLTKEDINNLRIGDKIWVDGNIERITLLSGKLIVTDDSYNYSIEFLIDIDNKVSLNPPKKKKKFWLWAISRSNGHPLAITDSYYGDDFKTSNGVSSLEDVIFKQKLDYTMIEIEVE